MRPLTIITGIVLGSAFSIAFGLAVVMLIFAILGAEHPQIRTESGDLGRSLGLFSALTVIAGLSFAAELKRHAFRWLAQLTMWSSVVAIGYHFWPD